ncbi:MAG TPA: zinc-binding dehydrogenase [Candidatus Aphodomonas merdavium]|nr:zinc-binding dehydrogenase [Candidatus Aphodomonas merdavium]
MKALVLKGVGMVETMDLPMPRLEKGQVLVRNRFCAVCNATDTKMYNGKHALVTYPCVFGHEGSGVVEAVGEGVSMVKPGDRVLGAGYPASPEMASLWGQYAQYGVAPQEEIIRVPDGVSLEHAALAHMLGEALNAARIAEITPGENVVILGCGAVGLSLLTVLRHFYPAAVVAVDLLEEKLELARRLGATHTIHSATEDAAARLQEITGGAGCSVLFEAVGSSKTYAMAYELLNKRGRLIPFGMIEGTMELPFRKLYAKRLQMRFVRSAGENGAENKRLVLEMMRRGLMDVSGLITGRYALEDFARAARDIQAGGQIRVLMEIE